MSYFKATVLLWGDMMSFSSSWKQAPFLKLNFWKLYTFLVKIFQNFKKQVWKLFKKLKSNCKNLVDNWGFPSGSDGKESTCNASDPFWALVWVDPLEKGMATHSSNIYTYIWYTKIHQVSFHLDKNTMKKLRGRAVKHWWIFCWRQ